MKQKRNAKCREKTITTTSHIMLHQLALSFRFYTRRAICTDSTKLRWSKSIF